MNVVARTQRVRRYRLGLHGQVVTERKRERDSDWGATADFVITRLSRPRAVKATR